MVSRSVVCVVVAFAFAAISLRADSVTTRDGVSLNGRVTTFDGRGAVVRARFEDGEKQILVPRDAIVGIEFNPRVSNAAGLDRRAQPASLAARRQAASANQTDDVVVLSTGEYWSCPPIEIDGQRLRCGAEVIALDKVTSLSVGRIR